MTPDVLCSFKAIRCRSHLDPAGFDLRFIGVDGYGADVRHQHVEWTGMLRTSGLTHIKRWRVMGAKARCRRASSG